MGHIPFQRNFNNKIIIILVLVPLDEVAAEWRQSPHGRIHLQTAASHCDVFRSLFGEAFLPSGFLGVTHGNGAEVYRGNILYPRQVLETPTVSLPSLHDHRQQGDARFFTLTLTNPDGNLQYNWKELLHWMMLVNLSISCFVCNLSTFLVIL